MKNKTKSVFGFIKVFAVVLVFSISTNMHAASTTVSSSFSEANLSALSLKISPIVLTAITGDWKKDGPWDKRKKPKFGNFGPKKKKDKGSKGCSHSGGCHCGGGNTPGGAPPTPDIPLDGGLSLLALGAAAFGIRKLRKEKNDKI